MNWKLILKLIASLNAILGATMLVPLVLAVYDKSDDMTAFAIALPLTVILNGVVYLITRNAESDLSHREGFLAVTLAWVSACLFASFPFYFSGNFGSFTNAYFEAVSGFTTTGSTILTDIASIPRATLFWRSIIQWYGGMGIIVLSLAVLPLLGVGGMQIFKAEVPGPTADKIQPRVRDTAMLLWKVYFLLTVVECLLLWVSGLTLFESVCHSFTTLATGGFGTRPDSLMSVGPLVEMIVCLFMFLAGVNFTLHYLALTGKFKAYLKDGEFLVYLTIIAVGTLLLTVVLLATGTYDDILTSFRYAIFQTLTMVTTTGYNSADFLLWEATAPFATMLLFLFMFTGGMAGSTGGGIKIVRIWLLLKHGYRELFRLIHPRAIKHVKVGGKVVGENVLAAVVGFIVLYMMLFVICTIIVTLFGHDFVTSVSAVAACIGNIGPGLGTVGPTSNFNHLQDVVKWILVFCMLLGRLEIYTVLLLLVPEFWKK